MRLAIFVACALGVVRTAHADEAADLEAAGEAAARAGDYAGAIDKFKAADRIHPTAAHACLISLAYTRRNLWPQAEVFRTTCHARATPDDPLPVWADTADQVIDSAIAAANVAAVEIDVVPKSAAARLSVSSFAPDEFFEPRTIHLPPGRHQIVASASGYPEATVTVTIEDKTARRIVIDLAHPSTALAPARSRMPWIVMAAGVGLGAIGGVLHATWYLDAVHKVQGDTVGQAELASDLDAWRTRREVVIATYALAGATVITGALLELRARKHAPDVAITIAPTAGGAALVVGWTQ